MRVSLVCEPGDPARPNEDFAAASHQVALVLDGAGLPPELDTGCVHGVAWYVGALGPRLLARASDPALSLAGALRAAIAEVATLHAGSCDLSRPATPSATAAVLRERGGTVDYLVLCDSVVLLEHTDGAVAAVTDDRLERIAARVRAAAAQYPPGSPEHTGARAEGGRELLRLRNAEDGFWVAAARPEAADRAVTGSLPAGALRRATLLTDGAGRLHEWGLLSWTGVQAAVARSGPAALVAAVRAAEAADADRTRHPRGKRCDDATVAACEL
ncbi:protein phosphatase 2C domain-containing protein [Allonocardiopsis opalescens]|uniref:Protein phosphatase 2C-like protein n=1 Tax=Allonocardiopsis opalescens TaxID=1144618 RepID=A0A2T0QCQ0_9ACTN|nr:protein phosphatase 2C domain-containing protein [Allonocardiopsis opalescens]PRY01633.1 protein phosphatase 2C-like protein [Allonocardiopsis opalescens]